MNIAGIVNSPDSDYANRIITNVIAVLGSMNYSNIESLRQVLNKYVAEILSEVSVMTAKTSFMIHNFSNIQNEEYVTKAYSDIVDIKNESDEVVQISDIQTITKDIESNLNDVKSKIESFYGLDEGTLSVYNNSPVEGGLDYTVLKSSSPVVFKYHEGKMFLDKIINFTKRLSLTKNIKDSNVETLRNTYVDKFIRILDAETINMQNKLSVQDNASEIVDILALSKQVYTYHDLSSNIDLFLGRSYKKIKGDIIEVIENTQGGA